MDILGLVHENFSSHLKYVEQTINSKKDDIVLAATIILNSINSGGKLLICGNGGSAADSQHFAAEFTGRYETERRSLPAVALTTDSSAMSAIANDYSFDVVFSKQVEALGRPGDILVAISTSGNSANVLRAIDSAYKLGMHIVALTGKSGGLIGDKISEFNDKSNHVNVCICGDKTARIQEVHSIILHTICNVVDVFLVAK